MAASGYLRVALCLLASQALLTAAQPSNIVAYFNDSAIAASINNDAFVRPFATGVITSSDLPSKRPPFPTSKGYPFCGYECARKVTVQAGSQTNGVLYVDVRYKPIPGVTAAMMQWLFNSLTGTAVYYGDGKEYPMYLIFHPRDHAFHRASRLPVQAGLTEFTWCEMILTNCRYNRNSATKPWRCPATARGYTKQTQASVYSNKLQTKEVMKVSSFTARGIEFNRLVDLSTVTPLASGIRTVATTRHTWSDNASKTALTLRTQLWMGMMVQGKTTEFDTGVIGQFSKSTIIDTYLGNANNIQGKNMTQVGWMNALHFLEEYGGLKDWLPQVYAGRTNK